MSKRPYINVVKSKVGDVMHFQVVAEPAVLAELQIIFLLEAQKKGIPNVENIEE